MTIDQLRQLETSTAELLSIPMKAHPPMRVDLSTANVAETGRDIFQLRVLEAYLQSKRRLWQTELLWGGYLEPRLIYGGSKLFHMERHPRNIHLGLDFWAAAGTQVFAPLAGRVHSFQDNAAQGDYGPTIILRHEEGGHVFHTLYGHLSRRDLAGLEVGQAIAKGGRIGHFGTPDENGQWPPHLHFQLILDMEGMQGDYPGVCALEQLAHYQRNCPDPRFLLHL